MINQIVGLFLPSIIGTVKCKKLFGTAANTSTYIERYFVLVLLTNLISYAVSIWIFKQPGFEFTNQFTFKYIMLSSVVAYLLPIIGKLICSNFNINLVVKKNEK